MIFSAAAIAGHLCPCPRDLQTATVVGPLFFIVLHETLLSCALLMSFVAWQLLVGRDREQRERSFVY